MLETQHARKNCGGCTTSKSCVSPERVACRAQVGSGTILLGVLRQSIALRVMRATAKLTLLVAVMAMTASLNAWAQTRDRSVDAQAPAEKPVTPELAPVFTVNNNIVGYYYLPTATNPGAGQTPKNALFFSHFDVWNYGTDQPPLSGPGGMLV